MARRSLLAACAALAFTLVASVNVHAVEPESARKARDEKLCRLLDEARKGKPTLAEVRLEVMGLGATGGRSVTVFGDGVGMWNHEKQFRVEPKLVRELLTAIGKAGFCTWPENASLIGKKGESEVEPDATRVARAMTLTIGELSKTVAQNARAEESAVFTALVNRLLDACEKDGQKGIGAASLQDGLGKVRDGTLDPRMLTVNINCPQQSVHDPEGWVLHLRGPLVETQRNTKATGYTDRKTMRLSEREVRDLAALLISADFAGLPVNIVAPGYTDLGATVLNRSRSVQARAFAGTSASAKPDVQATFAKLRQALHDIYQRAAGENKAASAR